MKHAMLRVSRVAMLAVFVGGSAAIASATPVSHFDVDFTGSGQMTVDVYGTFQDLVGGTSSQGFSLGSSQWNPIDFGSTSGYHYDGMAVFGRDTSDPGDDFVRYWFSRSSTDSGYRWTMDPPSFTAADETPVAHAPEPGSMILLGTGLIGLAAAARRQLMTRAPQL
jgi:hypothetical protein